MMDWVTGEHNGLGGLGRNSMDRRDSWYVMGPTKVFYSQPNISLSIFH